MCSYSFMKKYMMLKLNEYQHREDHSHTQQRFIKDLMQIHEWFHLKRSILNHGFVQEGTLNLLASFFPVASRALMH